MSQYESVKDVFADLPNRFNADAAKGMGAVIQFVLTGDDSGEYYVEVKDGACKVTAGKHASPNMTMTVAGKDYVAMSNGKLNPQMAFMQGKLKVSGDMGLAMKMGNVFKMSA